MKKSLLAASGILAVALAICAKDPIIMTINGVDVPKSEFEYLYNKNSQQQINPQTLEEYMDMFILYKMKVEDAKAEGLDTLPSFLKEMQQYRKDLSAPYLTDSTYLNKLVEEAYDRSQREVEVSHIMLFKTRDAMKNKEIKARMDSIRGEIKSVSDFDDFAFNYSQDKGSASHNGNMGYIVAGQYPYSFEIAAYALKPGEISGVIESPVGYHILKGGKSRNARGKVKVAHILKLTKGVGEDVAKQQIDSLYKIVLSNPNKFGEIAKTSSDDKGTATKNGDLPWFGAGEMVPEFDSVAFALPVGAISEPFKTSYGYHIIKKADARGVPPMKAMKSMTLSKIANPQDERYKLVQQHQTDIFAARHKAKLNENTVEKMRADVKLHGLDSIFSQNWTSGPLAGEPLATIDGKSKPASDFAKSITTVKQNNPETALELLNTNLESWFSGLVTEAEENRLEREEPDYRNLLKEYTDGSLLYEASVRKVWDRASKDTEGLEKYFNANKKDYAWKEPHVKGIFIHAANDTVASMIKERAAGLPEHMLPDSIRKEFKGKVVIENILIAKGGNPMVDHVAFGGPKVESSLANYPVYFMLNARILTEPEDMTDVKGLVTSDYQNQFQEMWENELRRKYPVKVNEKVLKSIKSKH